jgi:AcrR family transcriptional regulator
MTRKSRVGNGARLERVSVSKSAASESSVRRGRPGYDQAQVLEIAVQVFNEQGYDATSVAALATRLGLSKSALYHHFESKEALLAVALNVALDGLEGALVDAGEGTARDRLEHVLHGAVLVLVDKLAYVTLLLRVRGNSDVERAALERRRAFDREVTALVRAAQSEGSVRDDIAPPVATRLLFGMVNSIVEWYRPSGEEGAQELARDVLRVVFDGLGSR